MKKSILALLLFLAMISVSSSQWISNFGNLGLGDVNLDNAKGNAITSDALGNSYVTGFTSEENQGTDIVIIKYNVLGVIEWAKGYNGNASQDDEGTGICLDAGGNIYVVGTSTNYSRGKDLTILKYDRFGNPVWQKFYRTTDGNVEDRGLGIAVDTDNNVYVTGYSTNLDGYTDIVTLKYNASGDELWAKSEDGPANLNAQGLAIAVGPSGNVYTTGFITTANGTDIAVLKYNAAGSLQWSTYINGGANSEDKAWGIVVDTEDCPYITGYTTESTQGINTVTAKFNTGSGAIIWQRAYNGSSNQSDKAWGIVVDTDKSVYITGETYSNSTGANYLTVKYNSNGSESWAKTYNGPGNGEDAASSICIVPGLLNRTIVVTGKSWGSSDTYDYATVKYNASNGSQTATSRYSMNGSTNDIAKGITVTLGKVIVTGFSALIIDAPGSSYISTLEPEWVEESELISNNNIPEKFRLSQNFPNPFNPSTTISFALPEASNVQLTVYDMLGKVVSVLVNQQLDAGTHNISYSNSTLSSGVYFYELKAGNFRDVKKMNLIK